MFSDVSSETIGTFGVNRLIFFIKISLTFKSPLLTGVLSDLIFFINPFFLSSKEISPAFKNVSIKLSVIDFKTSSKPKTENYITNYFMQGSAYAVMFEERTGIPISNIVIIMAVEGNEAQLFQTKRDNYIEQFKELRKRYENENTK